MRLPYGKPDDGPVTVGDEFYDDDGIYRVGKVTPKTAVCQSPLGGPLRKFRLADRRWLGVDGIHYAARVTAPVREVFAARRLAWELRHVGEDRLAETFTVEEMTELADRLAAVARSKKEPPPETPP